MTREAMKTADYAMDKLRNQGYSSFMIVYDQNSESNNRLEILCSETTDPKLLAAMAKDALRELANPRKDEDARLAN